MLQTWNPWQELEAAQRRLVQAGRSSPVSFTPATDVVEDKDALTFYLDLPNLEENSLSVSSEGNRLSVKATRRAPRGEGKTVHYQGRPSGAFASTFRVPAAFDLSKVSATYEEGVLTLVVPRSESARPRQITVTTRHTSEGSADIQAQPQEQSQDAQYA